MHATLKQQLTELSDKYVKPCTNKKAMELVTTTRHLDALNQFAISVAEKEMPGFTRKITELIKKAQSLSKELGL